MEFINCCPHDICVFNSADVYSDNGRYILKSDDTKPSKVIKASGTIASVSKSEQIEIFDTIDGVEIVLPRKIEKINGLPEVPETDKLYIVSALTMSELVKIDAWKGHILTVEDGVKYSDGKIAGCLRLMVH